MIKSQQIERKLHSLNTHTSHIHFDPLCNSTSPPPRCYFVHPISTLKLCIYLGIKANCSAIHFDFLSEKVDIHLIFLQFICLSEIREKRICLPLIHFSTSKFTVVFPPSSNLRFASHHHENEPINKLARVRSLCVVLWVNGWPLARNIYCACRLVIPRPTHKQKVYVMLSVWTHQLCHHLSHIVICLSLHL